jgi:ATP-dependent helicase HrpA
MDSGRWEDSRADVSAQLAALLSAGFLRDTPADWLAQLPRYMKAVLTRVERLSGQYAKDQQHTSMLQGLSGPLLEAQRMRPGLLLSSEPACQYRWMLEELRVSLFSQNLGTRQAVSRKRLEQQWLAVEAWLVENPY